jgi:hypothetical protein
MGARQIARRARTSTATIKALTTGRQRALRSTTAAQLLAVRPTLAHGCIVAGTKTWRFVDSLEREGYTRRQIAWSLGAQSQQLQLARKVRVSTALRVSALYDRLTA